MRMPNRERGFARYFIDVGKTIIIICTREAVTRLYQLIKELL